MARLTASDVQDWLRETVTYATLGSPGLRVVQYADGKFGVNVKNFDTGTEDQFVIEVWEARHGA